VTTLGNSTVPASDLAGRRALVTGAGQGVGRAVSLALAGCGAAVAVNDYVIGRAESTVAAIRAAGGAASALPFDVSDLPAVQAAVGAAGPFDVLVNNAGNGGAAGWTAMVPFAETDPRDWAGTISVNFFGVLNCTHSVLPGMIGARWGRVVTVISDAGRVGEPNLAVYGAAKAAAAGLTRTVAKEVGRYGITANNVSLATIVPPSSPEPPDAAARLKKYVIRRFGTPEDAAALVAFLASPASGWITGQTYPVNGGYSLNL
jgi:NAD(P)-dependent dehydrogenase (short-subunit alcohol dehydrogenase family)